MSQRSYMLNGNNAVSYADPSGFLAVNMSPGTGAFPDLGALLGDGAAAPSAMGICQELPEACGMKTIATVRSKTPVAHKTAPSTATVVFGTFTASGIIALYRAVSRDEALDITKNGFRGNPNGDGYQLVKLFFRNRTDAERATSNYSDLDHITEAEVSSELIQEEFNLPGEGPAVSINAEDLPSVTPIRIEPITEPVVVDPIIFP